jgi:hypothetical protein
MAGSEEINRVGIEVYIDDQTAAGLSAVEGNVEKSAGDIGQAMDQNLGGGAKAATQQVDKLSKSVANATDTNNLASKSVNRLTKMFNPFNIGIGLAITGIVALGKHLYDVAVGPIEKSIEQFKDLNKELNEFADTVEKRIVSDLRKMSGVSEDEWERVDLLKKIKEGEESLISMREKAAAEVAGLVATGDTERERFRQAILVKAGYEEQKEVVDRLRSSLEDLNTVETMRLGQSQSATNVTKQEYEGKYGKPEEFKSGFEIKFGTPEITRPGEQTEALFKRMADMAGEVGLMMNEAWANASAVNSELVNKELEQVVSAEKYKLDARRGGVEAELELQEMRFASVEEIEKRMTESAAAQAQERMRIMEGLGGAALTLANMGGKIAASVAKTEKAKAKAEAVTAVIVASIQAALEVARAISSYPDFVGMAAHAAGAAAYIAAAVLAAKYGGGSPQTISSKGAGGGAGREAYGPPDSGETRSNTIIIQGHVFSPEGGADFVRRAMEASEDQTNPGRTRKDVR